MNRDFITIKEFYGILQVAKKRINESIDTLNDLNVFPVPDGDTGTNMAATFKGAVDYIDFHKEITFQEITSSLSKGALMSARGNSGVILSQILRGFARSFEKNNSTKATSLEFKNAFVLAKESAYKSVLKPKEGTILSVIAAAADGVIALDETATKEDIISTAISFGDSMLAKTKDMLPENKKANCVDAGGAGLMIILKSFKTILSGNEVSFEVDIVPKKENAINISGIDDSNLRYGYCTEFLILNTANEAFLKERLSKIGDSIVVVSMDGITKVHVHTDLPGEALNYGVLYGKLDNIKIDNMNIQSKQKIDDSRKNINQGIGVVAICEGDGISQAFLDSGADAVIHGGQSMNPSVLELVNAVESLGTENVIIFPNNKNIILAAEQVNELVDCNVYAIKSKSAPEGLAGLMALDKTMSLEENIEDISKILDETKCLKIARAAKKSSYGGKEISEGDYIGTLDEKIIANSTEIFDVIRESSVFSDIDEYSVATVILGKNIEEFQKETLIIKIKELFKNLDVISINGEQEIYDIIIGFEK